MDFNYDPLRSLRKLAQDDGECEAVCFSRDPYRKQRDDILVLPWLDGLKTYFTVFLRFLFRTYACYDGITSR